MFDENELNGGDDEDDDDLWDGWGEDTTASNVTTISDNTISSSSSSILIEGENRIDSLLKNGKSETNNNDDTKIGEDNGYSTRVQQYLSRKELNVTKIGKLKQEKQEQRIKSIPEDEEDIEEEDGIAAEDDLLLPLAIIDEATQKKQRLMLEVIVRDFSDNSKVVLKATDLSHPRFSVLLSTLVASHHCCMKLWQPKKAVENAYTKVSVRNCT